VLDLAQVAYALANQQVASRTGDVVTAAAPMFVMMIWVSHLSAFDAANVI